MDADATAKMIAAERSKSGFNTATSPIPDVDERHPGNDAHNYMPPKRGRGWSINQMWNFEAGSARI
jgi:hypothetical protein